MQTYRLEPHSAHPPLAVTSIEARVIGRDENWLRLRWRIEGSVNLVVPAFAGKGRADELWQTTCFELFLRPEQGTPYCEFNLSPSERWNAYDFDSRRQGMTERRMPREPDCTIRLGSTFAIFDSALPVAGLPHVDCAMALTCVIEETDSRKSYWALQHSGAEPDFHDPACFTAHLAAPSAT
ncbi:DOMON-like domain-containing protein [Qipengyuania qiaonensis]|uniref:DOMON-like domain-containing protein n=1 Tax=Qipengyuania qiaonensis TaxID=2867240 RepID=A0ABS7J601_9SPHN|nr:DOMON-like domain-containing protein [Qipengyuania qiaonensis]MBX7481304.1 DOMON-like domain-containing protein [Qipengyuania qiaonensis]